MDLPVYFPAGGQRRLLHWWTHQDRGHIALASREQSLVSVVDTLLVRHPDAEIKALLDVEIVAPPPLLCQYGAEAARAREEMVLEDEIAYHLGQVKELGMALPPPFSVCTHYDPENQGEQGEWAAAGTVTTLLFYNLAWRVLHPRPPIAKGLVPSRAAVALDNEPLWYVRRNYGHHAGGLELHPVDWTTPDSPPESVQFFFRELQSFDTSELNGRFKAAKRAKAEAQKAERMEHEAVRLCLK